MEYKIRLNVIEEAISKTHFANDGDPNEKNYWPFVKERFPNCETFWRYFVVPLTKRIQAEIKDPNERIRPRDGISEDIIDIASYHYSMFLNLIYAYNHLQSFGLSLFEDFYVHLSSACDLAEAFLLRMYLLILECTGQESDVLQKLTKADFLKLTSREKKKVLDKYLKDLRDWKQYKTYSQTLRKYRNTIVHDLQIGRIISRGGNLLVPKKEEIQNYKKWSYVFAAQQDIQKLKNDFIIMQEQMILDIGNLEILLNNLWSKPINDLNKLFFNDRNETLLKKYDIVY